MPEDIENQFKQLNISYNFYAHDALYNMTDLQEKLQLQHAPPIKNLFYEDRKGMKCYLISALKETVIGKSFWKKLGTSNRNCSMAKSQILEDILGVQAGSVTPFGLVNDKHGKVKHFIIDQNLMKYEWFSFHPLINTQTIELKRDDFFKWLTSIKRESEILNLEEMEIPKDT